jgi:hypothetical protein
MSELQLRPLLEACLRLRAVAPADWETFVLQVRSWAAHQATSLIRAPRDDLPRAQGYAQSAEQIATILVKAKKP